MSIPSGVECAWPSTAGTIPAGWTRDTTLDDRFVKQVVNASTNPGGTGGANTHTHPMASHTHPGGSHPHSAASGTKIGGADNDIDLTAAPRVITTHSHTVTWPSTAEPTTGGPTGSFDAGTSEPPFFRVIFIKSDGTPTGIPNAAVVYFNSTTLPTGWRATDGVGGAPDMRNRFWRGALAAGDGGGTGGTSDSHSHTSSHTHSSGGAHGHGTLTVGTVARQGALAGTFNSLEENHTHGSPGTSTSVDSGATGAAAATTPAGDAQPPWHKLFAIQNNSGGASQPTDIICVWTGTIDAIPPLWALCDGTSGTPNLLDKFVKALSTTAELGNTGGAATHSHASAVSHTHAHGSHNHGGSGALPSAGTVTAIWAGGGATAAQIEQTAHTHTEATSNATSGGTGAANAVDSANTDNRPAFTDVAFIQYIGIVVLAATLSFSGAIAKTTTKPLAGTLSFSGALTKTAVKALTGTLSFSGAITKRTTKVLTAALSFAGLLGLIHEDAGIPGNLKRSAAPTLVRDDAKVLRRSAPATLVRKP